MSDLDKAYGKLIKTYSIGAHTMWCETCATSTHSTNTTLRVYKNGVEVQIDHCEECKITQETEFFKGPTTRIVNRKKKK